jgi:cell division protein FtsB
MDFRIKSKLVLLSRPVKGLPWLARPFSHAEALAQKAMLHVRPALAMIFQIRRRVATVGVAILTGWLFVHVMFGANGMVVYRQKKAEFQSLQTDINRLQKDSDAYTRQIKALETDPKTIEKEAREQLHYARPGEVIYVPPPPVPPQRTILDSARK